MIFQKALILAFVLIEQHFNLNSRIFYCFLIFFKRSCLSWHWCCVKWSKSFDQWPGSYHWSIGPNYFHKIEIFWQVLLEIATTMHSQFFPNLKNISVCVQPALKKGLPKHFLFLKFEWSNVHTKGQKCQNSLIIYTASVPARTWCV